MRNCQSVLYVDDDPDICVVVRAALCLIAGLDVYTAQSGAAAIDLAYDRRPDLIVLDVMMPGLDGPATYRRLRQSPLVADTPVIFMTAKVLPAEVSNLLVLGSIGVVEKPFDPVTLGGKLISLWNESRIEPEPAKRLGGAYEVQAIVDSLTREFLERISKDALRLANLAISVQRGEWSLLSEMERLAHSIHGAGALFGFPAISESSGIVECLVEGLRSSTPQTRSTAESAGMKLSAGIGRLAKEIAAANPTVQGGAGMFKVARWAGEPGL